MADLKNGNARGGFVRDVLALANSALEDEPAWLIYGIEDPRRGSEITGIGEDVPSDEDLARALESYIQPTLDLKRERVRIRGKIVDVIGLFHTPYHPHWSTRDVNGFLRANTVYLRRGGVVSIATIPEVENFFRAKGARIDARPARELIQVGSSIQASLHTLVSGLSRACRT